MLDGVMYIYEIFIPNECTGLIISVHIHVYFTSAYTRVHRIDYINVHLVISGNHRLSHNCDYFLQLGNDLRCKTTDVCGMEIRIELW